jgi:hypothetical protein
LEKAHSAALSDLQRKPNRENSRKESSISRGLVCLPTPEPEKIPTSRPMAEFSRPEPCAHSTEILAAPGVRRDREARLWIDGGTARVSFTEREWPRGDARTLEPAREAFRASLVTSTLARAVVGTIIRRVIAPPHIRRRDVAEVERCIVGSTTHAAA